MEEYQFIVVESYEPLDKTGLHGPIHIRPIDGQEPFSTELHVECSKKLSTEYPVGTRFRIKAKITDREGGNPFVYSHYSWNFEVIDY